MLQLKILISLQTRIFICTFPGIFNLSWILFDTFVLNVILTIQFDGSHPLLKLNVLYCFISIITCLVGTLCSWVIHYCATLVAEMLDGYFMIGLEQLCFTYTRVGRFFPTFFARIVLDVCWIGTLVKRIHILCGYAFC